jgi:hypothetical protein
MVRANGANTNSEIRTFFSLHPPAQRPTFNAPFPAAEGGLGCPLASGQRRAHGSRRPRAGGGRASRGSCAHPHTELHAHGHGGGPARPAPIGDSRWTQTPANPAGVSATGAVKDHAQGFLVRINDVVDEPLVRRRMKHQEDHRPLRPIIERHWTCPAFVESVFKFTRPASRTEAG